MKLLLSSLVLVSLCALSSWTVSSKVLVVTQTPDTEVLDGDDVNITCCWTAMFERITVKWLKNKTEIKNMVISTDKNSQGYFQNVNSTCSTLTLTNVTREDSDKYICRVSVDIPIHASGEGNGTIITVTTRDNTQDPTDNDEQDSSSRSLPVHIASGVMAPLVLIMLISFCCLRLKQAQAARVIYEVPHFDSETQEGDKHSTGSSRGSSQWCQVPVYESFDYFEHGETKRSE